MNEDKQPESITVDVSGLTNIQLHGLAATFATLASAERRVESEADFLAAIARGLVAARKARDDETAEVIAWHEGAFDDAVGDVWRFGDNLDFRLDDQAGR